MDKLALPLSFQIKLHADTMRHRQSSLRLTLPYRLQAGLSVVRSSVRKPRRA